MRIVTSRRSFLAGALAAATDANGVEWYVIETESMQRKSMVPPTGCIEFLNSFKV